MFSGGVPCCTLWIGLNTKPPPGARRRTRSRTSAATWPAVAKGSVRWVSTPPPQNAIRPPKLRFSQAGSMPAAEVCTGLRMSTPASMSCGMIRVTEPQVCSQVFQRVCRCTQSFWILKKGTYSSANSPGENSSAFCAP